MGVSLGEGSQHFYSLVELLLRVAGSSDLSHDLAVAALVLARVAKLARGLEHQRFQVEFVLDELPLRQRVSLPAAHRDHQRLLAVRVAVVARLGLLLRFLTS